MPEEGESLTCQTSAVPDTWLRESTEKAEEGTEFQFFLTWLYTVEYHVQAIKGTLPCAWKKNVSTKKTIPSQEFLLDKVWQYLDKQSDFPKGPKI